MPMVDRVLYVGARSDIGGMTASSVYRDTMDAVLQDLATSGALAPAWAAWACDWAETGPYTDYDGTQYWLEMPYYATDSLGFITLKRFALDETGTLYTACSLTMDSRTGAVVDIWLSAPYDYFGGRAAQQAALEAAAEATEYQIQTNGDQVNEFLQNLEDEGYEITHPDQEAFRDACWDSVYDQFAEQIGADRIAAVQNDY